MVKERNSKLKTNEKDFDILKLVQVKFPVLTSQGFYIVMESSTFKVQMCKKNPLHNSSPTNMERLRKKNIFIIQVKAPIFGKTSMNAILNNLLIIKVKIL